MFRLCLTVASVRRVFPISLAIALAACSGESSTSDAGQPTLAAEAIAAEAAARLAARQQASALAALSAEDLHSRGRQALREQRIYTPAGNNAIEYYIALRGKSDKPNASAEIALMELQPYAVIAAEQALVREDFPEASRLHNLIAAADPQAPALRRLAEAIAKGKQTQAARLSDEATRVADQASTAAAGKLQAAQVAAEIEHPVVAPPTPAPATVAPAATPPASAPVATAAVSRSAPATVVSPPASRAAPDEPAPVRAIELVALRTPAPEFPREARRFDTMAEVVASFTVNADGSVSNIETVGVGPNRFAFERSVQAALKRWKYQPTNGPQTVTRSFNFAR